MAQMKGGGEERQMQDTNKNTNTNSPSQPYLARRDTLCSCEAYGVRPMYKENPRLFLCEA
jgi:hypothetical protein